jgi:excisionase family DNA binding protein
MLSDTVKQMIGGLDAILSINEVAQFFSVKYITVWRLIKHGKLDAYKDDENNWCINRHGLQRFCSENCNL